MNPARPLRVLIVEDEVLVAMELAALVEDLGHAVVGQALDSREALRMADALRPDLALVDIHLQDGPTGVTVARRLCEACGSMVLFMTANQKRVPEDFAGAVGLVAKPYSGAGVQEAVSYVQRCLERGCDEGPPPASLTVSPRFAGRWGDFARRAGDAAEGDEGPAASPH